MDIAKENQRLEDEILQYEEGFKDRMKDLESVSRGADETFKSIRKMTLAAYIFGNVLIGISIILFVFQVIAALQTPSVEVPEYLRTGAIGSGAIGVADLLGLLFYKPIDRMQKATGDFAQLQLISNSYAMATKLIMLGMSLKHENGKYNQDSIYHRKV